MTAAMREEVMDDVEMQVVGVVENEPSKTIAASTLSKSWSIASAHVPTYTGGKITHCHTRGIRSLVEDNDDDVAAAVEAFMPFLILPVAADLAIVDARRGVKARTIRQGQDGVVDDNGDEDEGMDTDDITCYALSWNDELLITCSRNYLLRQYDMSAMTSWKASQPAPVQKVWGRSGHSLPVTHMEFHRSNVFLATGSVDGTVRIWDVRGAYVTHVFRPMQGGGVVGDEDRGGGMHAVTSISWRKDVSQLVIAVGRDDGSIVIHDLRDEKNVTVVRNHVSAVTCMEWSVQLEDIFVTTGRDAILNTWRIVKETPKKKKKKSIHGAKFVYQRIHTLPIYEQVEGMTILHSNESDLLVATAGSKGVVRLWKASASASGVTGFECLAEQPASEAFGSDRGGYMSLRYNPRGHAPTESEKDDSIPLGREQLIVADAEHNLSFLSLSDKQKPLLTVDRTIVGHNDEILDLKVIPNRGTDVATANRIVVATNSAQVRVFELGNFSCDVLAGHSATVLCVDVSPCGRYLSTCGKDKTMRVWQLEHQRCVAIATGHTEAIGAATLSRKIGKYEVRGKAAQNGGGAFAVTASKDRTLKRWNLPGAADLDDIAESADASEIALRAFASVRAHEKDINIVSVAPNDSLIATGSQDKTVKLWRSTDLSLQATLKGHKRGVWDCQFSPFDRVVATASADRTVKLWSLGDYSCVRTFQGHVASALRVRFLSGGLQLVSSGADGLVKLWTIRTNECEATMDGHSDKVWALDLSPTGKTIVSGGADSQIVVWNDTTQQEEDAKRATEEQNIMMEQKLANHMRHKEYEQALEIALELEKPMQALKVLNAIVENDVQKGQTGLTTLQRHVKGWPMNRTTQVVRYCREWNTRALNSHIAMLVIKAVVTSIPAHTLAATEGLAEILAGVTPYAERHFDRLDRLHASSYLLDFCLFAMGSLETDDDMIGVDKDYAEWESKSKLVLPPKRLDGRIQVGGTALVGSHRQDDGSDDEVVTIGESDSSDDEDSKDEGQAGEDEDADEGDSDSQSSSGDSSNA